MFLRKKKKKLCVLLKRQIFHRKDRKKSLFGLKEKEQKERFRNFYYFFKHLYPVLFYMFLCHINQNPNFT